MANILIWSDRALVEYDKLQAYLFEEWGEETDRDHYSF